MTSKIDTAEEIILQVVRGLRPWTDLQPLGMTGAPEDGQCQFPASFPDSTRIAISDLARGLLAHINNPRRLREWAVLMEALPYDLMDAESRPEAQTVLNAVWSASFGDPIGEETIGVVTNLGNESAN